MAQPDKQDLGFLGFGGTGIPDLPEEGGVFILAVYRDGSLTAAAHSSERGAMEAAVDYLDAELDDDDGEGGTLEDRYARVQSLLADEGSVMEIIPSPIYERGD